MSNETVTIPAGTIVKVNGMPFRLPQDTAVEGRAENLQECPGLPPPDLRVTAFGELEPTNGRTFVMGDFYTADQLRSHEEMVREQCARIAEGFDAGGHPVVDEIAAAIRGK